MLARDTGYLSLTPLLHYVAVACRSSKLEERRASHATSFPMFHPAGGSIDSDCAFEPDYAVPPFSMTEGMQHIRIMEGMSRSLPSSPLLTHQTISMRLQPVKKLTGKGAARARDARRVQFSRISHIRRKHLKGSGQILWAERVWICSVQTSVACLCPPPNTRCTNTS